MKYFVIIVLLLASACTDYSQPVWFEAKPGCKCVGVLEHSRARVKYHQWKVLDVSCTNNAANSCGRLLYRDED